MRKLDHMSKLIGSLRLWVVLAIVAASGCQTVPDAPPDYESLAERAAAGEAVPVADLQAAFLASADFNERMRKLSPLEQQAMALMVDEPLRLGAVGSALLDVYFGSLAGHEALAAFYRHVDAADAAVEHEAWLARIRAHIEAEADGTQASPYPVISATEANAFLASRDATPLGSMYLSTRSVPFMMLVAAASEGEAPERVYFDLSDAYDAVAESRSSEDGPFSAGDLIGYLAQARDSAAQTAIGAYYMGERRLEEAEFWLKEASRSSNLLANLMLARVYQQRAEDADEADRDMHMELALEQYLHAVAVGSDDAMFALAALYLDGAYGEDNIESGIPLLRQAADLGNPEATLWLAHMYVDGTHVEVDHDQAEALFHAAAQTGSGRASLHYARFLLAHDRPFPEEALTWLQEHADANDPEAMLLLGNLYAKGVGVSQSFRRALSWFKSAVGVSPDDANIVNEVAWTLAVTNLEKLRKPRYALEIMDHVMEADETARENPAYLDTWAAAHAATGDFQEAVKVQEQAVKAAVDQEQGDVIEVLKEHLDAFQRGETIVDPVP
jgi:TPR repeat protein